MPYELMWNIGRFNHWRNLRRDKAIKSTALEDSPIYNIQCGGKKLQLQLKLVSGTDEKTFASDMKLIIFNLSQETIFEGSYELLFGKHKTQEVTRVVLAPCSSLSTSPIAAAWPYILETDTMKIKLKLYFGNEQPILILDELKTALEEGLTFTDFSLISASGEVFRCHKFILATRSGVLDTMLHMENMLEAQTGEMHMADTSSEAIQSFIKYLYTEELDDEEFSLELLNMAEKYHLKILKAECEKSLVKKVQLDNCVDAYVNGSLLGCHELQQAGYKMMTNHWNEVRRSEDWEKLRKIHPTIMEDIIGLLVKDLNNH